MTLFSHKHPCMISFDGQFSCQMSKALTLSLLPFPETWEVLKMFAPFPSSLIALPSGFFTSLR